ncbi:unnamed protein product, partial [Dicrocoelium dendriticum]
MCPENRLRVLESVVESFFDLDLIDEFIRVCHHRAQLCFERKTKARRDRERMKKEQKEEQMKAVVTQPKPEESTPVSTEAVKPDPATPTGLTDGEGGDLCE